MSAFLVSHAHINVLLTYARHNRLVLPHPHNREHCSVDLQAQQMADLFGRELLRENLRSLTHRYGTDHGFIPDADNEDGYLANYRFTCDTRGLMPRPGAIGVIKATHCFDYQACETPDYPKSWAAEIMRLLRDAACHDLPGYNNAPWGFDDPGRS